MKHIALLLLSILIYLHIEAQTSLALKSIRYQNHSSKTLNYLELPQTKASLNKALDSLSKQFWQIPSRLSNELIIQKTKAPHNPTISQIALINPAFGNANKI